MVSRCLLRQYAYDYFEDIVFEVVLLALGALKCVSLLLNHTWLAGK